jgi:flagellar motor switch protein FliN/FliY
MSNTDSATAPEASAAGTQNLKMLENIEVKLTVEVGGTKISIRDLLKLNDGSVVELERLAGEHLDILVNGTLLAKGEVVLVGERLGIRFTEIISPEQRVRNL